MVSEFRVARRPARLRPPVGPQQQEQQEQRRLQVLRLAHPRGRAQAQSELPRQEQRLRPVRKHHRRSAVQQQRPHAKLQEEGLAPRHLQAVAAAKRPLHQVKDREAQLTPDRAPMPSVSREHLTNAKPTLAHANRDPTLNALALMNPAQPKRLELITARNPASGKAVVRRSNLNSKDKLLEF